MAAADEDIKARLLATFRVEADEHLQSLSAYLLELARGPSPERAQELVETTFRAMHTLKGAARSVGLMDVEAVCQSCELVLSRAARARLPLTDELVEQVQAGVDAVAALVDGRAEPAAARALTDRLRLAAADADEPRPQPVEPERTQQAPGDSVAGTIRLDAGKLDSLLLQGEELLTARLAVEERTKEARQLLAEVERARATAGSAPLRQVEAGARGLLDRLARDRETIGGAVDGLLDEIRRTRMMPASTVLDLFPRMVRDIAREQAKEVELSVRGGELELDRRVLERMKDPLIHLVRNAIDHGLEQPEQRLAAGKPRAGRLGLAVSSLEDGRVEIVVEDDGRGIDAERVREAGVRTRLVTADAARGLADSDAVDLVFRSGLSTSPVITDVSGHGLGLAIVREQVQRLEGEVALESHVGAGTSIRLTVPAAISTFRGLLIRSATQLFLLPLEATTHVLDLSAEEIRTVEGRETIRWNDEAVPLARLESVLGLARANGGAAAERRPCVIVSVGRQRVGLLVDEVLGDEEVLVRELSPPLTRVRYIAGAGILGTGRIVLIFRAADLVAAGLRALRPAAPPVVDEAEDGLPPLVLVVDDAVTTRTMERNLLEGAGYRVEVAVDGVEAWTALKAGSFDLVVSDVDMPRMDGFELTARIRAEPQLAELPVVLVSALETREDKERGIEVGANAYVVKSSFEQSNLLEIIGRLGVVPGRRAER